MTFAGSSCGLASDSPCCYSMQSAEAECEGTFKSSGSLEELEAVTQECTAALQAQSCRLNSLRRLRCYIKSVI